MMYARERNKNSPKAMTDIPNDLESDFLLLAKVALSGRAQDIQLALHRTSKRYRDASPRLSESISALLRSVPTQASPLRRQSEAPFASNLSIPGCS